jgi:hypothetical protein
MVLRLSSLCTTMIANFVTASSRNCIAEGGVLLESSPAGGITCPAENLSVRRRQLCLRLRASCRRLRFQFFHLALGLLSTRIDLCPP